MTVRMSDASFINFVSDLSSQVTDDAARCAANEIMEALFERFEVEGLEGILDIVQSADTDPYDLGVIAGICAAVGHAVTFAEGYELSPEEGVDPAEAVMSLLDWMDEKREAVA